MTLQTKRISLSFILAAIAILLDRVSKVWVMQHLPLYSEMAPIPALKAYLKFSHSTNSGVAFGLFQGGTLLFTLIAAVAVIAIAIFIIRGGSQSTLLAASLGLMLGGAMGNLWDRLVYGSVVDFILVQASERLVWPNFNVADSAIVVGTGLLMLYLFLDERQIRQEARRSEHVEKVL
jgi:signal peptidase II